MPLDLALPQMVRMTDRSFINLMKEKQTFESALYMDDTFQRSVIRQQLPQLIYSSQLLDILRGGM